MAAATDGDCPLPRIYRIEGRERNGVMVGALPCGLLALRLADRPAGRDRGVVGKGREKEGEEGSRGSDKNKENHF